MPLADDSRGIPHVIHHDDDNIGLFRFIGEGLWYLSNDPSGDHKDANYDSEWLEHVLSGKL
jgi:hypothetical protein